MKEIWHSYSSYIKNAIILRRSNLFLEKIIGFFFRNVDFDAESLSNLKEYSDKGKIIYISFQSSSTSLLILTNLLRRHRFSIPNIALDFTPYFLQIISNFLKKIAISIINFFQKIESVPVSDYEYIEAILEENKSMILSLLSRKFFLGRYLEIKYDTIQYLIEIQKKIEMPIFVFPQIMFWNRNPERTRAFVTASATGDRRLLSALFTTFRSVTPAFIRISTPINLKDEITHASTDDPKQIARNLRNKLLEIYNHEKRSILGPVIKSQQEMMERVLYHKNVLDTIKQIEENQKIPEQKLKRKAYDYYKEIAADFSILYIKFFEKILNYIYRKIFDDIYYNLDELKKIREASQKGPLILMPSHKSHMDYLIISSIFYREKLIPPHIVAGSNLVFFPMGKIFRRSGAFFVRRSFRGLDLYASVFKQYIKLLINEGYCIEFFIEGSRSRTGKLGFPKMGILRYLIDAIDEGYNRDMVFIPISINYDRILEENSYQMELKGREKTNESTSSFVKSRKLLKRKYGKVYLSFDEPISFQEFRKNLKGDDVVAEVSNYIVRKINEIVIVTPFAVASAAILLFPSKGFSKEMLKNKIMILNDYLTYCGVKFSDAYNAESNIDEVIEYVIASYQSDNIIRELLVDEKDGQKVVLDGLYILSGDDRARISFYKNSIIQYLIPISFLSISIVALSQNEELNLEMVKQEYLDLKEIFSHEFIYPEVMDDIDKVLKSNFVYLKNRSDISMKNDIITIMDGGIEDLLFYAKVIQEYLESYYIVFNSIMIRKRNNKKDLIYEIRKNGIRMYHLEEIRLSESLSMPNYNNALLYLLKNNIINERYLGKKTIEVDIIDIQRIETLKSKVERYLKLLF